MNPLSFTHVRIQINPHRQTTSPLGSLYSEGVFHCFPPLNLQKKKWKFLSTPSKLRTKTGMMRSTNKQMKPESFHIRTGSFLYHFFFFFLNISATSIDFPPLPLGNIHRCAKPPLTATLAEAKNEIYTWLPSSTMCNHHLIGKWSRVQTGKGKAWLKPTSPGADDFPCHRNMANTSRRAPQAGRSLRPRCWHQALAELGGTRHWGAPRPLHR